MTRPIPGQSPWPSRLRTAWTVLVCLAVTAAIVAVMVAVFFAAWDLLLWIVGSLGRAWRGAP